ncbi:hypothetical protein [Aeromonas salmonicida]|uniref:hypothetical protein n=1 Tax=Aeromonas salmonicida TaxID=645 RepID=UPI000C88CF1C|nr:hypothetical protein [Aeromonas salmonicida]PMU06594.1 hypothetical protein CJI17_02880 [Aeromonas salmonicida]
MFVQLPFWLFPLTGLMALGALIALGIVLWRGDLCPGQRSRITAQLFSIWVITGLSLMLAVEAKVASWLVWSGGAALILGIVLSLAQSRLEGKRAIPSTLLWLAVLVGWQGNGAALDALIPGVLTQAILLIAALLLWFSPIYLQKETAPVVVSTALCGLVIAQIAATSVLHQLT